MRQSTSHFHGSDRPPGCSINVLGTDGHRQYRTGEWFAVTGVMWMAWDISGSYYLAALNCRRTINPVVSANSSEQAKAVMSPEPLSF